MAVFNAGRTAMNDKIKNQHIGRKRESDPESPIDWLESGPGNLALQRNGLVS